MAIKSEIKNLAVVYNALSLKKDEFEPENFIDSKDKSKAGEITLGKKEVILEVKVLEEMEEIIEFSVKDRDLAKQLITQHKNDDSDNLIIASDILKNDTIAAINKENEFKYVYFGIPSSIPKTTESLLQLAQNILTKVAEDIDSKTTKKLKTD